LILPIPLGTAGARKQGFGFDLSAKTENNLSKTQWQVLQNIVNRGKTALRAFHVRKQGIGFDLISKTGE
jgi:hypothetical protein